MTRVLLDASLAPQLQQLGQAAELCGPDGAVVGRFVPLIDGTQWEPVTPEVTEDELDEREQSEEWYSTEEVMAHLSGCEPNVSQ